MEEIPSLGSAHRVLTEALHEGHGEKGGKGHFRNQEKSRIQADAPAAGEAGGAGAHGVRVTAESCLLLCTGHGQKELMHQGLSTLSHC